MPDHQLLTDISTFKSSHTFDHLVFNSKGGLFESYLYRSNSEKKSQILIHSIKIEGNVKTKVAETILKI